MTLNVNQNPAVIRPPVRSSMANFIKSMMGSQFVIPVYQRNYTWLPDRETARYMNDIEDLLARRTVNHFLGIIIYMETDISAMFKQIQIVDGQQRLTTSFIFLLSLKRAARENNAKDVEGMIDDYYLYNRHLAGDAQMRLKPAVSDDDVFEKLLYGGDAALERKDRESNVYRNYEAIYQRILKLQKQYSLTEILDSLSRIDILMFPLSDNDNAQQIFESINSTGAPLTSADLIRNYILMNDANDVQERNYRMYWQPLEKYFRIPAVLKSSSVITWQPRHTICSTAGISMRALRNTGKRQRVSVQSACRIFCSTVCISMRSTTDPVPTKNWKVYWLTSEEMRAICRHRS